MHLSHATHADPVCYGKRKSTWVEDDNSEGFRCSSALITLGSSQCMLIGIKFSVFRRQSSWNGTVFLADCWQPENVANYNCLPVNCRLLNIHLMTLVSLTNEGKRTLQVFDYFCLCVYVCLWDRPADSGDEVEMSKPYAVKKINPHFADFYLAPCRWFVLLDIYIYTSSIIIYQSSQSCLFFTHMKNTSIDSINRLKTASKPKGLFFVLLQMHWMSAWNIHGT